MPEANIWWGEVDKTYRVEARNTRKGGNSYWVATSPKGVEAVVSWCGRTAHVAEFHLRQIAGATRRADKAKEKDSG